MRRETWVTCPDCEGDGGWTDDCIVGLWFTCLTCDGDGGWHEESDGCEDEQ